MVLLPEILEVTLLWIFIYIYLVYTYTYIRTYIYYIYIYTLATYVGGILALIFLWF